MSSRRCDESGVSALSVGYRPGETQIVIMGPSGSGKSTVGPRLAQLLGINYLDADDFHPIQNVEKMSLGTALTDQDRWPWLAEVNRAMVRARSEYRSTVVACSALRRSYRDALRHDLPPCSVFVIELFAESDVLAKRMSARHHYMPVSLLESQVSTLESLGDDEWGTRIGADLELERVTAAAAVRVQEACCNVHVAARGHAELLATSLPRPDPWPPRRTI